MDYLLPYLAGAICAGCFGSATVFEQMAASRQAKLKSLHPKGLLAIFRQWLYLLGLGLDLIGWLLFLYTADKLPLFLALSFVAASLVVTAVIAKYYQANPVNRSEWLAMFIMMIGLVLLGLVAEPTINRPPDHIFRLVIAYLPLLLVVLGLGLLRAGNRRWVALSLAALAGLSFGGMALIVRLLQITSLSLSVILQPLTWSLIAYGLLGLVLLAAALQRDNINRVNGLVYASELAIPSWLGVIFLNDQVKAGLWWLMVIGFVSIIVATLMIALIKQPLTTNHSNH